MMDGAVTGCAFDPFEVLVASAGPCSNGFHRSSLLAHSVHLCLHDKEGLSALSDGSLTLDGRFQIFDIGHKSQGTSENDEADQSNGNNGKNGLVIDLLIAGIVLVIAGVGTGFLLYRRSRYSYEETSEEMGENAPTAPTWFLAPDLGSIVYENQLDPEGSQASESSGAQLAE
jgi:hypothetical protein